MDLEAQQSIGEAMSRAAYEKPVSALTDQVIALTQRVHALEKIVAHLNTNITVTQQHLLAPGLSVTKGNLT